MTEDMWEEYLKMSAEITEKLDNTAEYESWLIIQSYVDMVQQKYERYKETVDRLIDMLEYDIRFCQNDSQGLYDKCNKAIKREQSILNILKEVE